MLFLCPWAKLCWFVSPLGLTFDEICISRLDRWLDDWLMGKDSPDDFGIALFAGICWELWRDYWEAKERRRRCLVSVTKVERVVRWCRPDVNMIKANFDAALCLNSRKAAVGVIARDENGLFLGGYRKLVEPDSAFTAGCLAFSAA